jgi:hypothetical protein
VLAVYNATAAARSIAVKENRPVLIEAMTYRYWISSQCCGYGSGSSILSESGSRVLMTKKTAEKITKKFFPKKIAISLFLGLLKGIVQRQLREVKIVINRSICDVLPCRHVTFTLPQWTPSCEYHKRFQRLQYFLTPSQPVGSVKTTA